MAIVSFFENVVVKDENKIREVRDALDSNIRSFTPAKIDTDEKRQEDIAKKWFSTCKK